MAYEGTSRVKMSYLQILTSRFEAFKMADDETLAEYIVRVLDITNESFLLGEKISDSKLVRKVLWFFPRRFNMKVTTIEEANDITKMKLDELFGSLKTFKLTLGKGDPKGSLTLRSHQSVKRIFNFRRSIPVKNLWPNL